MKTEPTSIFKILSQNSTSFFIPPFQRAYAWRDTMTNRFFEDIKKIIFSELDSSKEDKLEHFFGIIVVKTISDRFAQKSIIVDGQQRITTSLLFILALRDTIANNDEEKLFIDETLLRNSSSSYPDKIKLKQVTKDWEAFRALVNSEKPLNSTITDTYKLFVQGLKDMRTRSPEVTFDHYLKALQRLNIAVIYLDERPYKGEDPQIIFETLNSLGKPLTLSDLIRNYVLLSFGTDEQTEIYEQVWFPKIESVLEERLSDFFRDYLQLRKEKYYKVVRDDNTKELYQFFKDYIEEKGNTTEIKRKFIEEITEYVPCYKWLITEENNSPISSDPKADKNIKELLRNIFFDIKADPFKPLVMGLLYAHCKGIDGRRLSDNLLIDHLTAIRTYLIRRRIVKESSGENKNIITLSKYLDDLVEGSKTMFDLLSDSFFYRMRLPNDVEIRNVLERADFYKEYKSYTKFILGMIEKHKSKVSVDFRNRDITIEHIMPQNLSESWKSTLGEDYEDIHETLLHNIGNLILTEFNSEIGNKTFNEKKEKLEKSNLNFRNDVLSEQTWNRDAILRHRDQMIGYFLETFPLPDDRKRKSNWKTSYEEISQLSPLDQKAELIVKSLKPLSLQIFGNPITTKRWITLYIEFHNAIKNNPNCDYQIIMGAQNELLSRGDAIITWNELKKYSEKDMKKFKTFSGKFWDEVSDLTADIEFLHTNLSAEAIIKRMARIMKKLGLQRDDVLININKESNKADPAGINA